VIIPMGRRIAVAAAVAIILSPAALEASWRAAADSVYARAEESYVAGDYRDAVSLYAETVRILERNGAAGEGAYFADLLAEARFLEGSCHERLEQWDAAIEAYTPGIAELGPVADVVRLRLARCHLGEGDHGRAIDLLVGLVAESRETLLWPLLALEVGEAYLAASEWDSALEWFRVFLDESGGYDDRALARLRIAEVADLRGDDDAAAEGYAKVVDEFPRSSFAHEAFRRGRRISRAFTDRYHQGLVLYNRGRHRDAREFFEYYLRHGGEGEHRTEATYFLGRSLQRRSRFGSAARRYREVIEHGPETEYYDLAWLKLAHCVRRSKGADAAVALYDDYVALHPDRESAAEMLWEKARLLEEERRWGAAGGAFEELASSRPASGRAGDARFRAGLCLYKKGLFEEAEGAFADCFLNGGGEAAARGLFWAAKCREAIGHTEEAIERYRDVADAARDTYYGRRALDALAAKAGSRVADTAGKGAPGAEGDEASAFAVWLAGWHEGLYIPDRRLDLRRELARDRGFARASLLLALHLDDLAARELAALEERVGGDPRMLDILSDYYARSGLRRRAIRVAERIVYASPASGASEVPLYLRRKVCPAHFLDTVARESDRRGVDPCLMLSLIRQESLFEPRAVSWVGARGLAQIMPSTGRWIARKLGQRGFRTRQLLDPATNVEYGVYYLAAQIEDFDGDVLRALAAYNGGPENVERWWEYGGSGDVDVFVEDIGYRETNDYVRRVYLYWGLYREIYSCDG